MTKKGVIINGYISDRGFQAVTDKLVTYPSA